jgi:hypothetical protein
MSAKSEFSRQNNATFSFKYKDSYEKIKSNNYMWSLGGNTDRDPGAQHKRQLAAKNLVSFIGKWNSDVTSVKRPCLNFNPFAVDLNKRVYTALEIQRGDEEIINLIQPNDHLLLQHESTPVTFTEVTIEAVTPRLAKTQDKASPTTGGDTNAWFEAGRQQSE